MKFKTIHADLLCWALAATVVYVGVLWITR